MLRRQLILGISSGLLVSQGVRAKTVSDLVVPKERKLQLNAKPYYQLIEIKGTAFERGNATDHRLRERLREILTFIPPRSKNPRILIGRRHRNSP